MLEVLDFMFKDFWHWSGSIFLIIVIYASIFDIIKLLKGK